MILRESELVSFKTRKMIAFWSPNLFHLSLTIFNTRQYIFIVEIKDGQNVGKSLEFLPSPRKKYCEFVFLRRGAQASKGKEREFYESEKR